MIATTIDYQKLQNWRPKPLYCHFRLSVVLAIARGQFLRAGRPSMSHLFVDTFFDFGVVENFVYRARITVILILQIYSAV